MTDDEKKARIRELNDALRINGQGRNGKVVMVGDLGANATPELAASLVQALRGFNDFTADNDPHGEHDFGKFRVGEEWFIFKIDYYALDEETLSEHPEDPNVTIRVMSVFYAHDY